MRERPGLSLAGSQFRSKDPDNRGRTPAGSRSSVARVRSRPPAGRPLQTVALLALAGSCTAGASPSYDGSPVVDAGAGGAMGSGGAGGTERGGDGGGVGGD